jgi:hypothetical protein
MTKRDYEFIFKLMEIGNRAVKKAQKENLRRGIPNVYSKNKKLYFELPDGTITSKKPE